MLHASETYSPRRWKLTSTSDRPASIDADHTKLKLGIKTQISLIGFVIVVTAWTVTTYAGMATKANVMDALQHRTEHPETSKRLAELERADKIQQQDIAVLKTSMKKIDKVDDKIDFLTQQSVIEASQSPHKMERLQKAAQSVRSAAKAEGRSDDPLGGIEGL